MLSAFLTILSWVFLPILAFRSILIGNVLKGYQIVICLHKVPKLFHFACGDQPKLRTFLPLYSLNVEEVKIWEILVEILLIRKASTSFLIIILEKTSVEYEREHPCEQEIEATLHKRQEKIEFSKFSNEDSRQQAVQVCHNNHNIQQHLKHQKLVLRIQFFYCS